MKKKVLIIDDDREILRGLSIRLKAAGYEINTACNGQQGLSDANEKQPDAIVLDVRMPGMDGLTTLEKLREQPTTKTIPVIMLSASIVDQAKALELGARYFLEKPYDTKKLTTALHAAIAETQNVGAD